MVDTEKLKQLAELRDSGVLSEAEFEREKKKILGGVNSNLAPVSNQLPYNQHSGYNPNMPQKQTGLIIASYICAAVSLIFCPLVLGIIGMVLGFYANSQGDSRGVAAGIVSLICMILGMFIGMLMWSGTY